jgi:hypothetical protein
LNRDELMKSLPTEHIFKKGLLIAAAAVFSIATTGIFASNTLLGQQYPSLVFAQEELGVTDTNTTTGNAIGGGTAAATAGDTTATNATTTTTGGGNKLAGIIASLQLAPDRLAPEWVAAGYWELESDMPLLGVGTEGTQPTVSSFDGIVEMTRLADGTFLHQHTFSDFRPSAILHTDANSTTINGTMNVITELGPGQPYENVPVYITLQNDLISIAVDPVATENHFGPTPITGIILTPEHLQEISNRLTSTAQEGGAAGAGTEATDMTTETTGNTTGQ